MFLMFLLEKKSCIVYAKIVADAWRRLQRGDDVYPPEHEEKISSTLDRAMQASIREIQQQQQHRGILPPSKRTFRILEVGIGDHCRTIQRGLYNQAFINLETYASSPFLDSIDIIGLDIQSPTPQVLQSVYTKLARNKQPFPITFQFIQGDISNNTQLPFPEGYFDMIVCILVLCSVVDPSTALAQIKHLLRPDGGTFAYVEHVAVNSQYPSDIGHEFLEWQQQVLDPLQQTLAHNCHLHRYTDDTITHELDQGKVLWYDRFFVDDMWPVSCQCCGVIQRIAM